ncbi:MAG: retropepsin-like aspartic protease [Candidatus Tumulicola sp.]
MIYRRCISTLVLSALICPGSLRAQAPQSTPTIAFTDNANNSSFPFDWRKGTIVVPVRLNGSRPLLFVLDTGSTRMLVDRTIAASLGMKISGTGSLQGAGAGRIPIEFIQDVSMSLPGVESSGYEFSTADLRPLEAANDGKVDGILGYEFFRRFVITINYHDKILTLTSPEAFHPDASAKTKMLPIELRGKWAFVKGELTFPGTVAVQDSFLIDTGSSDEVDHPIVMQIQSRIPTTSGVGFGQPIQGAVAHAKAFTLGGYSVADSLVSCCGATDATSKLIGNEVLRRFTVTFDYPSSRMFIMPNSDY